MEHTALIAYVHLEEEGERECVSVCERKRERERVSVCVCERERET